MFLKRYVKKIISYFNFKELIKYLKYKIYIFKKSIFYKKYNNINIDYNPIVFNKNKFLIIKNLINKTICEELLRKSLEQSKIKSYFNDAIVNYNCDISLIKDKINEVKKIISNQMGFEVDICYDEITLYQTSRIENATSSFLWHRDGHFERYKLQILLTKTSPDSALEFDIGTHEINLKNEYEDTRFIDYIPKNSQKFIGEIGDAAIFTTSLIHRAGNCKQGEKRIVLVIPFLSENKYS